MKIYYTCPAWGIMEWFKLDDNFERQAERIKQAGYNGIEMWAPRTDEERQQLETILKRYGLMFNVGMGTEGKDVAEHIQSLETGMRDAALAGATTVACHSGRDLFSFEDNLEIVKAAAGLEDELGIRFTHETHRTRMAYCLPDTVRLLDAEPRMKLNADFSHWVCVHASDLSDQAAGLEQAIQRSYHVHARVGHTNGPQVTDPRAPEWHDITEKHFAWWLQIIEQRKREGLEYFTVCPEFGAPDYMLCLPFTRQPVADQFAINTYMKDELQARVK